MSGGPIQEVSIRGRTFAVAADASASRKLGGYESEYQPNGDGSARKVQSRVSWMISGLSLAIDDNRGDQEFLQEISDSPGDIDVAVTFASSDVYQGRGSVTGELAFDSQNSTAAVELSGPGKLTKQ